MIRRWLVGLAVGVLAAAGVALPRPPAPEVALATGPIQAPLETGPASGVAYCSWPEATDQVDATLSFLSLAEGDGIVSFPSGGESGPSHDFSLAGPGGGRILLSDVLRRGVSPAVVEFSAGPAAAGALVRGEGMLAGDVCPSSLPKVWQVPGGSTRDGETLTLRLFNPFPENASLNVTAVSEFGPEVLAELESIPVASRGWRDLNLSQLLPLRERLSVSVSVTQGFVVPSMELRAGDRAVWPGIGRSRSWEFPLVSAGGLSASLAILNPGQTDVAVEVDVLTASETMPGVEANLIAPGDELRLSLDELAEGVFGVRVRAEGPVSAVVVGAGEAGRAVAPGLPEAGLRWLIPGPGSVPEARYSLWIMNGGPEPATVTLRSLDEDGAGDAEKISVPAGTVRRVLVNGVPVGGLMAEALEPVSVAWSAELEGAVAYGAASVIDG